MRCEEVMTRNVAALPISAPILEAARLMAKEDVGFIPLVDEQGKAVGTVTDRDIVVRCVAKGDDCRSAKLSDYGGNEVACVRPEDDVSKAEQLMARRKVQRILVCDKAMKPVGVISLHDLAEKTDPKRVGSAVREMKHDTAPAAR